jgi:hypothetical protein
MSASVFAISGILCLALGIWFLFVGRDPKKWRLWWLDLFGILDVDTSRSVRRGQEFALAGFSFILFGLLIAMSVSCSFWSVDEWQERLRPRTSLELELEFHKKKLTGKPG